MGRLGRWRDRAANAALGVELQWLLLGFQASLARIEAEQLRLMDDIAFVRRRLTAEVAKARLERDGIAGLSAGLAALRTTAEYSAALDEPEPLVSVRIASFRRTAELMDVALASVFAQSYERLEVVIVNDGPNEATRRAIEGLRDPRVRYEEFPRRSNYPEDPHARWMVAGSPGMNRGADLAIGTWLAPLDEDDAFTPDHVEKLLGLAQRERVELAYGALIQRNTVNNTEARIFSEPPAISQFSFQGALYLRMLGSVFRYDEESWLVEEPGDWNLIRRMTEAGVTMAATDDVVAVMNQVPYTHKGSE